MTENTVGMNTIRVMIVDDHRMVRNGLTMLLREVPDFELIAEATNGAEAVRMCEEYRPDVILMDLVMPEMDRNRGDSCHLRASPQSKDCGIEQLCQRRQRTASSRCWRGWFLAQERISTRTRTGTLHCH